MKKLEPIEFSDSRWKREAATIPDLAELLKRHQAFRKLDLHGRSTEVIKTQFFKHYGLFPMGQMPVDAADLNRAGLFRARWIDSEQENPSRFAAHSYPEPKLCKAMGRANLPGKPVLYLSEKPTTAIFEIGARKYVNQQLFISRWAFDPGSVNTYVVMPGRYSGGRSSEVHDQARAKVQSVLALKGSGKVDSLVALSECWSELFLDENYPVTSWMADRVFSFAHSPFDILVYPSVARQLQSACFAVPRRVVDIGRIRLVAAIALDVKSLFWSADGREFRMNLQGLAKATTSANGLEWAPLDVVDDLKADFPDLLRLFSR